MGGSQRFENKKKSMAVWIKTMLVNDEGQLLSVTFHV